MHRRKPTSYHEHRPIDRLPRKASADSRSERRKSVVTSAGVNTNSVRMDSERGAASQDVIDVLFVLGACADSAGCMTCTFVCGRIWNV